MTKKFKVLVLTDHSGHSDQNSIYAILKQMNDHPACASIDVVSRGVKENVPFFEQLKNNALFGVKWESDFRYSPDGKFFKNNLRPLQADDYQIVFLRLPRPVSDEFLLWIETIFNHTVIINRPSGIIETSNKKFLLRFPELCPDMKLCHSIADIREEATKHPIVLKPLKEYGGKGLLKINGDTLDDGSQIHDTYTYLQKIEDTLADDGMLCMKFLENVIAGDKRILVVDGEILAASLRLPPDGSWLCNVSKGGTSVPATVDKEEREIIDVIRPELHRQGVLIYGVDTLVGDDGKRVLSEINTLSIGGFPQAEVQTGRPVIKLLLDKIFEYASHQ